jgi:hypothetical protein
LARHELSRAITPADYLARDGVGLPLSSIVRAANRRACLESTGIRSLLQGMNQLVCQQSLATGKAWLISALAEIDVTAVGDRIRAETRGQAGRRRVGVDLNVGQAFPEAALDQSADGRVKTEPRRLPSIAGAIESRDWRRRGGTQDRALDKGIPALLLTTAILVGVAVG